MLLDINVAESVARETKASQIDSHETAPKICVLEDERKRRENWEEDWDSRTNLDSVSIHTTGVSWESSGTSCAARAESERMKPLLAELAVPRATTTQDLSRGKQRRKCVSIRKNH